ncbi:hypothetical protein [Nesterenkonia xinjiangensis]|uniref:Uncharacterized protein n=1 Tax=Nesterenkonia xinjiangensis TaxID=225327 RepID=A0A7Z0GLC1_9MICC|nr:hypothetical protein [Nesterenkonia xinjiangensis]NYJ78090.1 hypothetical protein [Nesterenkonia xinjiangensis]
MKTSLTCLLVVLAGFTVGMAREAAVAFLQAEPLTGIVSVLALAAAGSAALYGALRRGRPDAGLERILARPLVTAVTATTAVLAFYLPRMVFRGEAILDLLVAVAVATTIVVLAGVTMSAFYRRIVPEDPEGLD